MSWTELWCRHGGHRRPTGLQGRWRSGPCAGICGSRRHGPSSWRPGFLASWLPGFLPSCLLCLPAFLASCLPAFLPSCLPAFLPSCLPAFLGWTVVVETGKGRDGPPASPAPLSPASDRIPQGVSDPPGSVEFSACSRDQGVIENPLVRSNNCRCTVLGQDHPGSARSQPATKVCDREHRSGQSPLGSGCREGRKWWPPEGRGRNEESPPGTPGGDSWGDAGLCSPASVISRGDQGVITQAR